MSVLGEELLAELRGSRLPLHVYIGGARCELARVEAFIARVRAAGHIITHDWTRFAHARDGSERQPGHRVAHEPPMTPEERLAAWRSSLAGICEADACVFLAPLAGITRGMWAELGACQAAGETPIYVGHIDDSIATSMCHVVADDDAAFAALETT